MMKSGSLPGSAAFKSAAKLLMCCSMLRSSLEVVLKAAGSLSASSFSKAATLTALAVVPGGNPVSAAGLACSHHQPISCDQLLCRLSVCHKLLCNLSVCSA